MKLKVLAGAKEGTEIPLKRSKFLIGRSSECTLRAGSEAISRRHCVVLTTDSGIQVRDLGSRNGTLVNGVKIAQETLIHEGDTLKVGPLEFRFVHSAELKSGKKPRVKSVAEAVDRAASQSQSDVAEDDISKWLLGPDPAGSAAMRETMSFRVDETRSSKLAAPEPAAQTEEESEEVNEKAQELSEENGEENGDDKDKKERFGKLPNIPKKLTKDSREAATDILREMARRR